MPLKMVHKLQLLQNCASEMVAGVFWVQLKLQPELILACGPPHSLGLAMGDLSHSTNLCMSILICLILFNVLGK